ncbi:MAG TPA: FtsX-like permease family protein [Candidatus Nanopelagicaceae bacterium]|nr:FtsX-like permease family protein [Candidatus Nanopelagicaceae bacterium]
MYDYENSFFFSGGISIVFIDFTNLVLILILILAFVVVIIVTSTLIITKKRDIAIMKALGSIPQKLYGFYLTEVYVVFFIGFVIGAIMGFISYVIFFFIASFLGVIATFQIDFFYTPILFISCFAGIFLFTGVVLRKIGTQNTIKLFSRDIPSNYDASKKLTTIPKWLSLIGYNFKISVLNTLRRKGEFKRYLVVFTIISLIIFTLGLGSTVLTNSSQEWIKKSQGTNIIAIGHKDVLQNYTLMYGMFSNPDILVTQKDIDFLNPDYLFNLSKVEELTNYTEIEKIDQRLINFFNVTELDGYHYLVDGGYLVAGQDRKANIPVIGFNASEIIQDFEIEGEYIVDEDSLNMMIGDGLGYNLFDYPLDQSMRIEELGTGHPFHISAVVIDSFYSGFAGYVDLGVMQGDLNFSSNEINLLLLQVQTSEYNNVIGDIELIVQGNLGENFSFINLNQTFENNYSYLELLALYPSLIIIMMAIISILALYNYQKGNIIEKAKDFLIMRAVGSKYKSIKKILFLEAFYMIIPSLLLSMGFGMIINSLILFDRVYLPNISLPIIIIGLLFIAFLSFNYISLFPILSKIKKFTIKDFDIW